MIAHRVLPQDLNPKYTISFSLPKKKKKEKENTLLYLTIALAPLFSHKL